MTSRLYTREEMIQAFWAGYKNAREGKATFATAREFVDGLQNPPFDRRKETIDGLMDALYVAARSGTPGQVSDARSDLGRFMMTHSQNAVQLPGNAPPVDSFSKNGAVVAIDQFGFYQPKRESSLTPGMVSEDALTLLLAYKADFEAFKKEARHCWIIDADDIVQCMSKIDTLDSMLSEFKLKTQEREVAMVRAVVRITMESMIRFQFSGAVPATEKPVDELELLEAMEYAIQRNEAAFANTFDWMTSHLNTYFPELTEGAE